MTSPLGVDLTELSRGVHHFTAFAGHATGIRQSAANADLSSAAGNWGLIGKSLGFDDHYLDVASAVETHTQMIEKFLHDCANSVAGTKRGYEVTETDNEQCVADAGAPLAGGIGNDGIGAGSLGGVRLDTANDIPVWNDITSGAGALKDWDVGALLSTVADLAFNVAGMVTDPAGWLISSAITVIIDLIQPLEDLLSYVTGNAERISDHADAWDQVQDKLGQLSDDIKSATSVDFAHWTGESGSNARQKLGTFVIGLDDTQKEVAKVSAVLTASGGIMQVLQSMVISAIAWLVEKLIERLAAGAAGAAFTAGISEAAAMAEATVEAAVQTAKTVDEVVKIARLLEKARDLLDAAKAGLKPIDELSDVGTPASIAVGSLMSAQDKASGGTDKAPEIVSGELAE